MRPRIVHILTLAALFACAAHAQGPRAEQGKVIAKIVVEEGQVLLQTKTAAIPIPGQLGLREGDVVTTSEKIRGRFELPGGKNLLLGRLRRYRVGRDGIQEPAGEGGWRYITQAAPVAPARPLPGGVELPGFGPGGSPGPGPDGSGLIAKARVTGGKAYHRPNGWPQEVPALPALSLAAGDELRLDQSALAQIQLVGGGWLFLAGPALIALEEESLRVDAGAGMAKALGARTVILGPYRIHAGARVFSFETNPGELTVSALTGVLTVLVAGGKPVYLAPGRTGLLTAGKPAKITPIAIKPEIARWEDGFNRPGPRIPAKVETGPEKAAKKRKEYAPIPGLKTRNPDGEGPERRSGPPDPRVEEPRPIAELPLRDRIKALDGPRNRWFYAKKRDERETAVQLKTFEEQVGKVETPDEVTAFRLFKLDRQARRARSDLNNFRQSRELSFNERPYRVNQDRDRAVRGERERLFALPLFLETRRLLPFVEGNRARLIAGADAVTRDILIARETGQPESRIAALTQARFDLINEADRETDGLKELIRLSMEPYR